MKFKDTTQLSYLPETLMSEIRQEDSWKFKELNTTPTKSIIEEISSEFYKTNASIKDIKKYHLRGNSIFVTESLYDTLVVRRTNTILRLCFAYPVFSREQEVRQLKNIFSHTKKYVVIRTDISRFYESVEYSDVISKIKKKGFYNPLVLKHLKNINNLVVSTNHIGLPRGLSISSTLSEYYLKQMDDEIRGISDCIYYCRYVDDIVAIFNDNKNNYLKLVKNCIPKQLSINTKKTYEMRPGENRFLEYLGYSIGMNNNFAIKIADKKISKIKRRIVLSVRKFNRDKRIYFLIRRMKFLASNSQIPKTGRMEPVFTGIRYQYNLCDVELLEEQLRDLDNFYRRLLTSKRYKPSIELRRKIKNPFYWKILLKISFLAGFRNNYVTNIDRNLMAEIKKAWKYE